MISYIVTWEVSWIKLNQIGSLTWSHHVAKAYVNLCDITKSLLKKIQSLTYPVHSAKDEEGR